MAAAPRTPQPHQPLPPDTYARLFEGHADGVKILEELTQRFVRPAKIGGGIDGILETYQRDGSRRVIEFIIQRINMANGAPANVDE